LRKVELGSSLRKGLSDLRKVELSDLRKVELSSLRQVDLGRLREVDLSRLRIVDLGRLGVVDLGGLRIVDLGGLRIVNLRRLGVVDLCRLRIVGLTRLRIVGLTRLRIVGLTRLRIIGLSGLGRTRLSGLRMAGLSGLRMAGLSGLRVTGLNRLRVTGLNRLRMAGLNMLRTAGLNMLRTARLSRLRMAGLGVDRLKQGRCGGSTLVGVGDLRKEGANGRVQGLEGLFQVDRSRGPLKVLHVDCPNAFAGLTSPDGDRGKSKNVSRKECPVDESNGSDPLRSSTNCSGFAKHDSVESSSCLSPSGEPHDGQVGPPPDLEGNPRGVGTITEPTDDEQRAGGKQVKGRGGDT